MTQLLQLLPWKREIMLIKAIHRCFKALQKVIASKIQSCFTGVQGNNNTSLPVM